MGDAQRRKKAGLPAFKSKPANRFAITLTGNVENSYVAVNIRDTITNLAETLQFHLYVVNKKLYAEVFYDRSDADRYGWIGTAINEISPLICRVVVEQQSQSILLVDRQGLAKRHSNSEKYCE